MTTRAARRTDDPTTYLRTGRLVAAEPAVVAPVADGDAAPRAGDAPAAPRLVRPSVTRADGTAIEYDHRFIASTEKVASDGGIIRLDAWGLTRYQQRPRWISNHDLWASSAPIPEVALGRSVYQAVESGFPTTQVGPSGRALVTYMRYANTAFAQDVRALYDDGGLDDVSVRWDPTTEVSRLPFADEAAANGDDLWWVATYADLLEVSAVLMGADPGAQLLRSTPGSKPRVRGFRPEVEAAFTRCRDGGRALAALESVLASLSPTSVLVRRDLTAATDDDAPADTGAAAEAGGMRGTTDATDAGVMLGSDDDAVLIDVDVVLPSLRGAGGDVTVADAAADLERAIVLLSVDPQAVIRPGDVGSGDEWPDSATGAVLGSDKAVVAGTVTDDDHGPADAPAASGADPVTVLGACACGNTDDMDTCAACYRTARCPGCGVCARCGTQTAEPVALFDDFTQPRSEAAPAADAPAPDAPAADAPAAAPAPADDVGAGDATGTRAAAPLDAPAAATRGTRTMDTAAVQDVLASMDQGFDALDALVNGFGPVRQQLADGQTLLRNLIAASLDADTAMSAALDAADGEATDAVVADATSDQPRATRPDAPGAPLAPSLADALARALGPAASPELLAALAAFSADMHGLVADLRLLRAPAAAAAAEPAVAAPPAEPASDLVVDWDLLLAERPEAERRAAERRHAARDGASPASPVVPPVTGTDDGGGEEPAFRFGGP